MAGGDRPIRVLRVIARLNVGGPAMHVVHLARGLDARFETRLVCGPVGPEEGDMTWYATERGVEPVVLDALRRPLDPTADLRTLAAIRREIREFRPDVVHTHTAKAGALGRLAAILEGVPVVVHTYHGHVLGGSYFSARTTAAYRWIERQLGRGTDRLIALTEAQAAEMSGPLDVAPRDRFEVIPLGLDLGRFLAVDRGSVGADVRREVGTPEGRRVVGIVGRLVPVKNHELLLRAWAAAADRLGDAELWIVGSGELESTLRERAVELGLDGAVRWLGWREDLDRIQAALDLLVLTSHDEGTPVALIEGLAAGTPILSTDVGGIREMLGRTDAPGTVVPAGDEGAFAEALVARVAGDGAPADPAVRARVAAAFSVEGLCERVSDLYLRLLSRKAPELGVGGAPRA